MGRMGAKLWFLVHGFFSNHRSGARGVKNDDGKREEAKGFLNRRSQRGQRKRNGMSYRR